MKQVPVLVAIAVDTLVLLLSMAVLSQPVAAMPKINERLVPALVVVIYQLVERLKSPVVQLHHIVDLNTQGIVECMRQPLVPVDALFILLNRNSTILLSAEML